jgi:hypothetical protein
MSGENPIVQEFVATYEVPAIEFENLVMQKYKMSQDVLRITSTPLSLMN